MTDDLVKRLRERADLTVPVPTDADQAAMMVLIGTQWLRQNAPERLKQQAEPVSVERPGRLAAEKVAPKFWKAKGLDPCENCGQLWRTHTGGMWKCPDRCGGILHEEKP